MRFLRLILANLLRKKARAVLTLGSFAVALFLFGLLAVIRGAFDQGETVAGADRLAVINKTSLIMPLPFSYRDRLRQVPGVSGVTHASWFGGVYQDEKNFFPQFAVDTETYLEMYPEFAVPPDQWKAFLADREGCVVGSGLAQRFGFKIGDRIPIRGTIVPGPWEFNVRAVYSGKRPADDTSQFWFHYDYLEERRTFGKGTVGWYTIRVSNPDAAVQVAKTIDGQFSNSSYETRTQTEKAFAAGFAKQMGNIEFLVVSIGTVVFFTLLLVTGNTMAISVRERTRELAVLKTIGFPDRGILALILAESMIFSAVGGGIGLALVKIFTLGGDPTRGLLGVFYLPTSAVGLGFTLALAVGLASGFIPAVLAMRLRVIDALRRV